MQLDDRHGNGGGDGGSTSGPPQQRAVTTGKHDAGSRSWMQAEQDTRRHPAPQSRCRSRTKPGSTDSPEFSRGSPSISTSASCLNTQTRR